MNCGLGSFAFTWALGASHHAPDQRLTPDGFLDQARRLGATVVQACENLPLADLPEPEICNFHRHATHLGIAVELGTRGLDTGNLHRQLALAVALGSPLVRVSIDRGFDEPSPEEVIRRLRPLLPDFHATGIALALENHERLGARTLARIIEELGPDDVGACLDTANSLGALETPEEVVEILGPHTRSLHVRDFEVRRASHQMGFVIEGCAAGQGRLDLPRLLARLRGLTPYAFNAILETWVAPGPSLEETVLRERVWTEQGFKHLLTTAGALPPGMRSPRAEVARALATA